MNSAGIRIKAQNLRAEAPPSRRAAAERKGEGEHLRHVDARPLAARGSSTAPAAAAEPGVPSTIAADGQEAADHDDHQPVAADADAEEIDLTSRACGILMKIRDRSHDVIDRRHRHEERGRR